MGLYLYCVAAPDHPDPAGVKGIEGAHVRALDIDTAGLRTWVSTFDAAPTASLEHVRAHNAVVEAAAEVRTPLPMRFGQWFASERELAAALAKRKDRLRSGLDRVRDAMEYGVRVLELQGVESGGPAGPAAAPDPGASSPDRSSGRAYLEGLARREGAADEARRRGARIAAELGAYLGALIRDQRVRPGGGEGLVAISHLVARHDTGGYSDAIDTFSSRRPDLRFVTSGPWPPYGFVDGS